MSSNTRNDVMSGTYAKLSAAAPAIVARDSPGAAVTSSKSATPASVVAAREESNVGNDEVTSANAATNNVITANIARRNARMEERKCELLLEARKSRINWIFSDGYDAKGDVDLHTNLSDGVKYSLQYLQACRSDFLPCAPEVIESLLSSRYNGDEICSDSKISSILNQILERENLTWEVVSNAPPPLLKQQCGEDIFSSGEINDSKMHLRNERDFLSLPPLPLKHSYVTFLQTLSKPDAADLVLSIQKFCKTVKEAAQVMISVQEENVQKHKQKELKEKLEQEKKLLQQRQHPLNKISKKSNSQNEPQNEKDGEGYSDSPTNLDPIVVSKTPYLPSSVVSAGTESSDSSLPQSYNHGASLAKALRGFINTTIREMEAHPEFRHFLGDGRGNDPNNQNMKTDTETGAKDGHFSGFVREQLIASFEKFLYSKCRKEIYTVLGGEIDPGDDNHHYLSQSDVPNEPSSLHGNSNKVKITGKTIRESEKELHDKMLSLQFVTPDHLEINCLKNKTIVDSVEVVSFGSEGYDPDENQIIFNNRDDVIDLSYPIRQLKSINDKASPRQMLQCIMLAHRGISVALNKALGQKANHGSSLPSSHAVPTLGHHTPPGADDVLPTLILAVLRAHPSTILTDLRFIEYFAPVSLLRGEGGYAYTNLCGAVQFLRKLDIEGHMAEVTLGGLGEGAVLSISPEEFQSGLERCRLAMKLEEEKILKNDGLQNSDDDAGQQNNCNDSRDEVLDASQVGVEHAKMTITAREIRDARAHGETVDLDWALRKYDDTLRGHGEVNLGESNGSTVSRIDGVDTVGHLVPPEEPPLPSYFSRSYSFLAAQPNDIRMSDLHQLLCEYRMLVHSTESLLNERTTWREAERKRQIRLARENMEKCYMDVIEVANTDALINGHGKSK